MLKLYDVEVSGNCYKVRLFAALLGLPLELVPINLGAGEHKQQAYLDKNPFGQVPYLEDGTVGLRDSNAILVYLARKYGGDSWLPSDPVAMSQVVSWLVVAGNEIDRGPADARRQMKFGYALDGDAAREKGARVLGLFEQVLAGRAWLVGEHATIADLACMPYLALAYEGGLPLDAYPNIRSWIARFKTLPGFVSMPGI
jgi:glutathione S-transferase